MHFALVVIIGFYKTCVNSRFSDTLIYSHFMYINMC